MLMKSHRPALILFFCIVLHGSLIAQAKSFSLYGKLVGDFEIKELTLMGSGKFETIAVNESGEFTLDGTLKDSGIHFLKIEDKLLTFWFTQGTTKLEIEKTTIFKTDTSHEYNAIIKIISAPDEAVKYQYFGDYLSELFKKYGNLTEYSLAQREDSIQLHYYDALKEYITSNRDSKLSATLVENAFLNPKLKRQLFKLLNKKADREAYKSLAWEIKKESLLEEGKIIKDFSQPMLDGGTFKLSNLKSKFILIEFWASDCGPCRAENPNLRKVYDTYHEKGFEIVGISLDEKWKDWNDAVIKDQLLWIHVSDLKNWKNAVAKKFMVDAIPFNVLIDANRKIITTDVDSTFLEITLQRLLEEPVERTL